MKKPLTFKKTHYLVRIHSFTHDEPLVLCEEVLSCFISRSILNPGHSFNLSLMNVGKYFGKETPTSGRKIKADDWIEIFHSVTEQDITRYYEQAKKNGKTYNESDEEMNGMKVTFISTGQTGYVKCKRRFLGRIDYFPRTASINDGIPSIRSSLSGKSWGDTIVQQPAIILPYFEGGFPMANFANTQYKITNTPDKNIRMLLEAFWANETFTLPTSLANVFNVPTKKVRSLGKDLANVTKKGIPILTPTIFDITDLSTISECDGEVANTQMLSGQGKMYNLLQSYSNPLLNEFWTDLDMEGKPFIVLREYPYSSKKLPSEVKNKFRKYFDDLETVEIDAAQWKKVSTGASGHERYNWFAVTSEAHPMGTILSQKSEIYKEGRIQLDEESIHRYGIRQYEQGTLYSAYLSSEGSGKSFEQTTKYTKVVKDWYKNNHEFLAGTIEAVNVTELVLGRRIVVTDVPDDTGKNDRHEEAYYCTGAEEAWQNGGIPTQTFTVVRGHIIEKRYGVSTHINPEKFIPGLA